MWPISEKGTLLAWNWMPNNAKMGEKMQQKESKMVPKWYQNGTQMVSKWCQNDTKRGQKRAKNALGCCENVANVLYLLRVLKHWKWMSRFWRNFVWKNMFFRDKKTKTFAQKWIHFCTGNAWKFAPKCMKKANFGHSKKHSYLLYRWPFLEFGGWFWWQNGTKKQWNWEQKSMKMMRKKQFFVPKWGSKCIQNDAFWSKKWVKKWQQVGDFMKIWQKCYTCCTFWGASGVTHDGFGTAFWAHLDAFWTHFGSKMRPKCTQNGAQMEPKWSQKGVIWGAFWSLFRGLLGAEMMQICYTGDEKRGSAFWMQNLVWFLCNVFWIWPLFFYVFERANSWICEEKICFLLQ